MNHMKFLAPLVAIAILLSACGDDDDAPAQAPPETSEGGTEASSPDAEGDDRPMDPTATYTFADSRIAESFDPHKASDNYDVRWLAPVYDRLVHAQANGEIGPGLATEWEYVDDTTLEMELREGVTFHDGEEFNAAAVVANIERAKSLPDAAPVTATAVEPIETVEAIDDHTVRFNLNRPAYGLIYDLAIQPGFMISPAAFDNPDLASNPVGAGMYQIQEVRPGDRATYTRYEDYWDPEAAAAETLVLVTMPNADTRLNAVISGEVDSAFLEWRQVETAQSASGVDTEIVPTMSFFNLYTNKTDEFGLDDAALRQAIAYAVDREVFANIVGGEPSFQPFPDDYFAYNPDIPEDYYTYDPERARELLAEAGYPDGITLEIQVYNRPEDQQMTELLISQMAEAGITLIPRVVDPAGAELFTEGGVPLFLGRFGGRLDPLQTLRTTGGPGGGINPGGGSTPEFAELLDQIDSEPAGDERTEFLHAAVREAVESALIHPLFIRSLAYVSNECVVGFEPYLSGSDEYRGVGIAEDCR